MTDTERANAKPGFETRPAFALKSHPANERIYGERSADAELIASVAEVGILDPLVVTTDDVVLGGHRRLDAAVRAGLDEVPVLVRDVPDEEQEAYIVQLNMHEEKTTEQRAREAKVLKAREEAKAKARMTSGANQHQSSPPVNLPEGSKGDARDIVAEALGTSGKTVDAMIAVVDTIDELRAEGRNGDADKVAAALNDKSVRQATILAAKAKAGEAVEAEPKPKRPKKPKGEPAADEPPKPGPVPEPTPDPDDDEEPAPPPGFDCEGIPLPPESVPSFALLAKFREVASALRSVQRITHSIAESPGGEQLSRQCGHRKRGKSPTALTHRSLKIEDAASWFVAASPHCCRCPRCPAGKHSPDCGTCNGLPYVTREAWRRTPEDYRLALLESHLPVKE